MAAQLAIAIALQPHDGHRLGGGDVVAGRKILLLDVAVEGARGLWRKRDGVSSAHVAGRSHGAGRRRNRIGYEEIRRQRHRGIDTIGGEIADAVLGQESVVDQELPRETSGRLQE